ncbi:hypothetical protein AB0G42_19510 [Streptomyces yangpuensis]|uniref:hypothetical protein n=1 Tax=Streptomyces yangpuensis TaxID=1648182 RepID=UPI00342DB37F
MRKHGLTTDEVEAAVTALLNEADSGQRATVSGLARRLGVNRQTLYRDFTDVLTRMQTEDADRRSQPGRPRTRNADKDREAITRLRREKSELTRHLHIYEDHIRRLTLENQRLRAALEARSNVTVIGPRPSG